MKKMILLYCGLLVSSLSFAKSGACYASQHYDIYIDVLCEEGNVACDKVTYHGVRKSDGATIRLKGKTMNRARTLNFYGYEFKNGAYFYRIYLSHMKPFFQIQHKGRVIAQEPIEESACID